MIYSLFLVLLRKRMNKKFGVDKLLKAVDCHFTQKPVKMIYEEVKDPVFTLRVKDYSMNVNKPYVMLSLQLEQTSAFGKFLQELDEIVPLLAYDNRLQWFPTDLHTRDYEILKEGYKPCIREAAFSLYIGEALGNQLSVPVYDNTGKPIKDPLQELAWGRNGMMVLLLQCQGIWFKEESFGLGWKILQISYKMQPRLPRGCTWLDPAAIAEHRWAPTTFHEDMDKDKDKDKDLEIKTLIEKIETSPEEVINIKSEAPRHNALMDHDD
jgi:hypothetical protein